MLKIQNFYFLIIIPSVIPLLISGPFLPDLIVSISSLYFLVYIMRHKLLIYLTKKPLFIFFIFCIYCILNSIFVAKDTLLSFESSLFYFRIGIFSCLIWFIIEHNKKLLNYFYFTLFFSIFILNFDALIQYFTGCNILGFPAENFSRISSFFGD